MNNGKINKRGKVSGQTFVVEIKGTENHTWQGLVKWIGSGKTVPFRSALELMMLIDSAVEPSDTDAGMVDQG